MKRTIQARLDADSEKDLDRLVRQLGLTPSQVVRESLKLLAGCCPPARRPRIIGAGKFASGVTDLGSNKKHMEGFGR